jgi:hypothetical protein
MKIGNSSIARVEEFKYLGTTSIHQNSIELENACYHSVKFLSFIFLSQNVRIKIYGTTVMPFVLYGCETWSLKLRDEHGLSVFENRVLRCVFGRKRDEVTRKWRKLHNKEQNVLYSLPNILRLVTSRRMRRVGHVARMGGLE